jgi:O-antigen ligase
MHSPRLLLLSFALVGVALLLAESVAGVRSEYVLGIAFVVVVFVFVFVKTEAGLYLVLFSMLLSPEFAISAGRLAESRAVILRLEDLLLVAIALSWLAKTAVNKELGLVVKTPLNRWIFLYSLATFSATLIGYLLGTVKTSAGFFYVIKYLEYFVVYYLTVNNLRDRPQAWRLVMTAFLTAAVVSLVGAAQIPSGQRVTAPFEGEIGEPNTLGGYLLFMGAVVAGVALETERLRQRALCLGLLAVMAVPFIFTLSRASYLGVVPVMLTLAVLARRRFLMGTVLGALLLLSPLLLPSLLPQPVKQRVVATFQPERGQATVRVGRVGFDPSTSERLVAMGAALDGWLQRPILGYGVTGFRFMDAQYARTLVETGAVGFVAFLALLWVVLKSGLASYRELRDPEERGLALGFVAGAVGLIFHAVGANTFIIVRIMEPFWFFAGVVIALPALREAEASAPMARQTPVFGYSV